MSAFLDDVRTAVIVMESRGHKDHRPPFGKKYNRKRHTVLVSVYIAQVESMGVLYMPHYEFLLVYRLVRSLGISAGGSRPPGRKS